MKKIIAVLFSALFVLTLHAQKTIISDENVEVRTLSGSFSKIKVSGGIDLYISQGNEEALAVSASKEKYIPGIRTEVKDGVLYVYYKEAGGFSVNINWNNSYRRVYISCKMLEGIDASGASDVYITGVLSSPSLKVEMSGASDLKGELKVDNLSLDLSGASDAKLSGTAGDAYIEVSGASDLRGFDLITENCKIRASGSSDVDITVNKELNVQANGASDVRYKGNCNTGEISSSGSSSIGKRN